MSALSIHSVSISWGISRGRDSYGYNICRAVSRQTGKTYRTIGGGYDMVGTVIGNWFAAEYQEELQALCKPDSMQHSHGQTLKHVGYYGLFMRADGTVYLDGACGIDCMLSIIKACGYEVQRQYNPRSKVKVTTGYLISKVLSD